MREEALAQPCEIACGTAIASLSPTVRLLVLSLLLLACRNADPGFPDAGPTPPTMWGVCETNSECVIRYDICCFPCVSVYDDVTYPGTGCLCSPNRYPLCICSQNRCTRSWRLEGMDCPPPPANEQCDTGLKCCRTATDGGTEGYRCVASSNGMCP